MFCGLRTISHELTASLVVYDLAGLHRVTWGTYLSFISFGQPMGWLLFVQIFFKDSGSSSVQSRRQVRRVGSAAAPEYQAKWAEPFWAQLLDNSSLRFALRGALCL